MVGNPTETAAAGSVHTPRKIIAFVQHLADHFGAGADLVFDGTR